MNPVLTCQQISLTHACHHLWHDYSRIFYEGERVVIQGYNGAGKTTFLRVLLGLIKPTSGKIIFYNHYRESIGYVPQLKSHVHQLSAMAWFKAICWRKNSSPKEHDRRIQEMIERLNVEHFMHQSCCQLSGGQRQCLLVAQAFLYEPKILFLDEPFTHLDFSTQALFLKWMEGLKKTTIIFVTHDASMCKNWATDICYFQKGQILSQKS